MSSAPESNANRTEAKRVDRERPTVRPPTQDSSSTDLASPTTIASPATIASPMSGRRRQPSTVPEPFPNFDSDTTASTADSSNPIPKTTLLSSSIFQPGGHKSSSTSDGKQTKARRQDASQPLKSESDRTDALWAEMQATLADVELSASRGTHFFGAAHSAALDELRNAQVELAKAWARGESDDTLGETGRRRGETESDADSGASPGTSMKSPDEDGAMADNDIKAAKQRREANDRYFYNIQKGVLDVVDKLEGVAQAMGKVERESREVWAGSESEDLDSNTS